VDHRWSILYQKEIMASDDPRSFFKKKVKEKQPLLKKIRKYSSHTRKKMLEAGCGTGVLSTYLANRGFKVTALDNDENMLKLARDIADLFPNQPKFVKKTLLDLDYSDNHFDISFSHGVLEHFKEEKLIKIINNQLRVAKILIFSVPSNYFKEKDKIHGDEHFLSIRGWEKIIDKTNGEIIEKFGYYFQNQIKALLYYLFKIFTPPYIGFVISKK